jgi:hypothetical protein
MKILASEIITHTEKRKKERMKKIEKSGLVIVCGVFNPPRHDLHYCHQPNSVSFSVDGSKKKSISVKAIVCADPEAVQKEGTTQ